MTDDDEPDQTERRRHDAASDAEDERARKASEKPVDYDKIAEEERDEKPG